MWKRRGAASAAPVLVKSPSIQVRWPPMPAPLMMKLFLCSVYLLWAELAKFVHDSGYDGLFIRDAAIKRINVVVLRNVGGVGTIEYIRTLAGHSPDNLRHAGVAGGGFAGGHAAQDGRSESHALLTFRQADAAVKHVCINLHE